jgi:hypothetical protein
MRKFFFFRKIFLLFHFYTQKWWSWCWWWLVYGKIFIRLYYVDEWIFLHDCCCISSWFRCRFIHNISISSFFYTACLLACLPACCVYEWRFSFLLFLFIFFHYIIICFSAIIWGKKVRKKNLFQVVIDIFRYVLHVRLNFIVFFLFL